MEPRRRFKFLKELAQGGFGKVYLAEMITGENFSSVVAIKLLHGRWLGNDEIVMRSRDEARLLGRLRHRNIVRVEDLTSINGQCAIVMEYLQGVDLKTVCTSLKENGKIFPRKSIFESIGAMASALDAAYTHRPLQGGEPLQVIHRDIKPSNAMITVEGDVKVLDFGTARASFEDREAKTQVLAFGSQAYMAPERMLGEPDSPTGDIFSLGVTMYECLTLDSFGKIPLRQERYEPTIAGRIDSLDLSDLTPGCRELAIAALRKMLAYEADGRPSAAEVIEDMEAVAEEAKDAGLKRFAREAVKKIYDAWVPEADPNDPYTGAMMFEDVTGMAEGRPTSEGNNDPHNSTQMVGDAAAAPEEGGEFTVPPELAELPVDLPGGSPALGASAPAAFAAPPDPPRVASFVPGLPSGSTEAQEPPKNGTWPPPSKVDTGQKSAPRIKPASTSGPVPIGSSSTSAPTLARNSSSEADETPSGGAGKIFAALAVVGLLGLGALAIGGYVVMQGGGGADPNVTPTPVTPTVKLPSGTPETDWSANQSGKGGAVLRVPDGASEVTVSNSAGLHQEWDGSMNLRLKDVEPGSVRTKVKLNAGSTKLIDFAVEADKTCLFTLRSGSWEKGECR